MRSAEPGRRALLEAGHALLAAEDLSRLSVNAIAAQANMAKGSFYQHWRSRGDYIVALHRAFHDDLTAAVTTAIADLPPGAHRLTVAIDAYLDGCLSATATKALLVQARTEAGLGDEVAARNREAATILTDDLAAIGWQQPEPLATLLVAAIAETALIELTAGAPRRDLRDAVLRLATASK
ncbi:TetR/AcrR family transcriptional regulator [Nocardia terpenica]|uniref:TetR family transcriptional regulator n=1 Tax=Nocardia terpenica TaxID=455432 RepID=A0A291RM92_9NOCA|nr:TetR/AcrR family transcriptional regulator [Nocardia terpenica]ATL68389.1 TetR family transcriptional regulator [Nocardia terpenica]